jgi:hypothetical protein
MNKPPHPPHFSSAEGSHSHQGTAGGVVVILADRRKARGPRLVEAPEYLTCPDCQRHETKWHECQDNRCMRCWLGPEPVA